MPIHKIRAAFLLPLSLALLAHASAAPALAAPSVPFLPGIMVADGHPRGCVDCHVQGRDGKDNRLNTSVLAIKNHPNLSKAFKDALIPDSCILCHKASSKLGSLTAIIHKVHYEGREKSAFITLYQGACLNCHMVDLGTGIMSIKRGPSNW
ncbi:MAG: hypothetical protein ACOYM2_00650 [Rectinemataceae bacterium]